jgi:hypothetical protein
MVPVVWGSDWATPSSGDCQAKAYEHEHDLMQTNHERGGKKKQSTDRRSGGIETPQSPNNDTPANVELTSFVSGFG